MAPAPAVPRAAAAGRTLHVHIHAFTDISGLQEILNGIEGGGMGSMFGSSSAVISSFVAGKGVGKRTGTENEVDQSRGKGPKGNNKGGLSSQKLQPRGSAASKGSGSASKAQHPDLSTTFPSEPSMPVIPVRAQHFQTMPAEPSSGRIPAGIPAADGRGDEAGDNKGNNKDKSCPSEGRRDDDEDQDQDGDWGPAWRATDDWHEWSGSEWGGDSKKQRKL